eukprot:SAG31_NODE_4857_length_2903_cov_2.721469_1_plen_153_part_00
MWFFVAEFTLALATALFCFAAIMAIAAYADAFVQGTVTTMNHSYLYLSIVSCCWYVWVSQTIFLRAVSVTRVCRQVEKDSLAVYEQLAIDGVPENTLKGMLRFSKHVQAKSLAFRGFGITVDDTLIASCVYAAIALCISLVVEKVAQSDYHT